MKGKVFLACVALLSSFAVSAQRSCGLWLNEVPLVADTAANSIYVTIEPCTGQVVKGTLRWDEERYAGVQVDGVCIENGTRGNFAVSDWTNNTSHTLTFTGDENHPWKLFFSTLPFLVIDCPLEEMEAHYSVIKGDENHTRKYAGHISVIDARCRTKLKNSQVEGLACFDSDINIRLRGATSGSKPKKSFNVELTRDGETQDVHLLGYRKDDDWILSSEYTDYSRMRNRVLMDLWNSVDDLPYAKDNHYQCNGTQGEFVEVFVNGEYYGLMCFTDKLDRKKLNLKKTKAPTAEAPMVQRGLLWKANWESEETYLSGYSARPANDSFLWPYVETKDSYAWEQKYPDDSLSQAFFDPICDVIDFLHIGQTEFSQEYQSRFYEQNVIDFILFIQTFQLLDNQKKNYYLSVRNVQKQQRYLFTLWDLDGSIGRLAGGGEAATDAKHMAWGEKLGYHYLIHRFKTKTLRPDDFATKMNNRWQYLSTHQLSLQRVRALMEKYANAFVASGAWEREKARWLPTYHNSVKIADTPQEEVEFMMSFLQENYNIFNQQMASATWEHEAYNETEYEQTMQPAALYVIGNDIISTHEDNTVTLPGTVRQEAVDGLTAIHYKDSLMTIVREAGENPYLIGDIKEVRTSHGDFYATPAFVPDSLQHVFAFDTRYAPVRHSSLVSHPSTFIPQRTVSVFFDGVEAVVSGNLDGITAAVEGTQVSLQTALEGLQILVSGASELGHINIRSQHPCLLAAAEGGALLSSVTADCDLIVNTSHPLNFYNDTFDGKCISTSGDIIVEDGQLYFLMTGSGTLTDASFLEHPELGARAVMAQNIWLDGGQLCIKTLGHNGAVGLAAVKNLTINGGSHYIATYDDPIKVGSSVTVNGGFTFTSSLTNDGLDSKGDLFVNGGLISTYSPEGAEAAFDVNHFHCNGGTVIGIGYKSEQPMASKSTQAAFRLYKSRDVLRYVKIADADGRELAVLQTPAYSTLTIVYSAPCLQKGTTYTLFTSDTLGEWQPLSAVTAE